MFTNPVKFFKWIGIYSLQHAVKYFKQILTPIHMYSAVKSKQINFSYLTLYMDIVFISVQQRFTFTAVLFIRALLKESCTSMTSIPSAIKKQSSLSTDICLSLPTRCRPGRSALVFFIALLGVQNLDDKQHCHAVSYHLVPHLSVFFLFLFPQKSGPRLPVFHCLLDRKDCGRWRESTVLCHTEKCRSVSLLYYSG